MLGFTFRFVFGKARHIQADWPWRCTAPDLPSPAPCQMPTTDRFLRSTLRLHLRSSQGSRRGLEIIASPLRILGNDKLSSQRQHHRYVIFLRVLNGFHGCFRHGFTRLATHQIRGRTRAEAPAITSSGILQPAAGSCGQADGEGTFPGLANQRKATTNRAIHAL